MVRRIKSSGSSPVPCFGTIAPFAPPLTRFWASSQLSMIKVESILEVITLLYSSPLPLFLSGWLDEWTDGIIELQETR